jgi:hypothetical protein
MVKEGILSEPNVTILNIRILGGVGAVSICSTSIALVGLLSFLLLEKMQVINSCKARLGHSCKACLGHLHLFLSRTFRGLVFS